ncbi:MAG: DUF4387 family protein [Boseongicola sp.]
MPELGSLAKKVRSKNAGPFWITIDIFCDNQVAFERIRDGLNTSVAAKLLGVPLQTLKRFDMPELNVVKISIPRPEVQGTIRDRDMHGAAIASLLAEMEIA